MCRAGVRSPRCPLLPAPGPEDAQGVRASCCPMDQWGMLAHNRTELVCVREGRVSAFECDAAPASSYGPSVIGASAVSRDVDSRIGKPIEREGSMNRRMMVLAVAFALVAPGIALGADKAKEQAEVRKAGTGRARRRLQVRAGGAQGRRVRGRLRRLQQLRHEDPRRRGRFRARASRSTTRPRR